MVSDRDIWAAANEVIRAEADPILFAVTRYDDLLGAGDMEGCALWWRIGVAIRSLLAAKPPGAVH